MRLELQHVVGQVGHITEVAEDVVDAIFEELRRHGLIALGQGLRA
jgi:hypothetical protein